MTMAPATQPQAAILVVDDEQSVLRYVAKHLRESAYTVVTAASGEEALAIVEQQNLHPDVLVADLVLPGISGFALVDAVRRTHHGINFVDML